MTLSYEAKLVSFPAFRWLMYFGALSLFMSVVLAGVGLLRNLRTT